MREVLNEEGQKEAILALINSVDYGEVIITIHNSQIMQVEKREKKRFKVQKQLHQQS